MKSLTIEGGKGEETVLLDRPLLGTEVRTARRGGAVFLMAERVSKPAPGEPACGSDDEPVCDGREGQSKPELTDRKKQFVRFTWFSTFEENTPYVIKLSAAQVNVLANLSEWAITNEPSKRLIGSTFGNVLTEK